MRLFNDAPQVTLRGRLSVQRFDGLEAATPYVDKAVRVLTKNFIQREQRRLQREILAAQRAGDEKLAQALWEERKELFLSAASLRTPRRGEGTGGH